MNSKYTHDLVFALIFANIYICRVFRFFILCFVCENAGYAQRMRYYLAICLAPHSVFVFTSVCMESYGLYGVMT